MVCDAYSWLQSSVDVVVVVTLFVMKKRVSKNVVFLGLVSFFNDVASEMLYPIIPIFLTAVLGAPVFIVRIIEGIAESVAHRLKLVSGYVSDRVRKRKIFVIAGYVCSALAKPILALVFSHRHTLGQ